MKNFIEFTDASQRQCLINIRHIVSVRVDCDGDTRINLADYEAPIYTRESYPNIKTLIEEAQR